MMQPISRVKLALNLDQSLHNDTRPTLSTKARPTADLMVDPDRIRRRQLLFSMLAAASTVQMTDKAARAEPQLLETTTTVDNTAHVILDPVEVIKSPLDDREYRTFTLPNGLRVLLCSDPSSNEAAVCMDVHVGAMSDPVEVPGLAHFCEHMLFLGTKKVRQLQKGKDMW